MLNRKARNILATKGGIQAIAKKFHSDISTSVKTTEEILGANRERSCVLKDTL